MMNFQTRLALVLATLLPAPTCNGRPLLDERSNNDTLRARQTTDAFYPGGLRAAASYDPFYCNSQGYCYYLNPDNAVFYVTIQGGTLQEWTANQPYGDCYDDPNHCEVVFDDDGNFYVGYDDGYDYTILWETATSGQYNGEVAGEADLNGSPFAPWITMKDYNGMVIYYSNTPRLPTPPPGGPGDGGPPPSCQGNCPPPGQT